MFTVLTFSLATACYAFTKILQPLVKSWHSEGLRVLLYLDDGIVAIKDKEIAALASKRVREDLVQAGLVEHTAKCMWDPVQKATWVGFGLDLARGQISVPNEKIQSLKSLLLNALGKGSCVS